MNRPPLTRGGGRPRRRLRFPDPEANQASIERHDPPLVCRHCARLIPYGPVIVEGDVVLHPHCVKAWHGRTALPLI